MARRLPQLSSPTLADQAYDALRDAIITGDLAPREKITERGLADHLAISADHPVTVDAPPSGPEVPGDEGALRQVVANLFTNARVHTPPGTTGTDAVAL